MTTPAITQDTPGASDAARPRWVIISALGITQILAWGSSFYLPAVLAKPIADDTGWSLTWIVGAVSLGLLLSGFLSPRIGRLIDRTGGRPVLATSAVLIGSGQTILALAPDLMTYVAGWLVMGLGMGCGLYDAAFSALGRLYGRAARSAISALTLWGGFASTVCWPLSAALVDWVGWRSTCLIYAALQLLVVLPLYLLVLPRSPPDTVTDAPAVTAPSAGTAVPGVGGAVAALSMFVFAVGAVIMSAWSVHLLTMLQAIGVSLVAAVALGALVGPSQVGARIAEMMAARFHHHPIWTQAASSSLVALGLCALALGAPVLAVALIVYGAGSGLSSIARGTLPLALFGPTGYATLMGWLVRPSVFASAIAPWAAAMLMDAYGATSLLFALTGLAVLNVACVGVLYLCVRQSLSTQTIGSAAQSLGKRLL
jgi:predicted MFS family arabinose efflux permease